jgi:hypothetical protein
MSPTHCKRCNQPLVEIDHYGERLIGCTVVSLRSNDPFVVITPAYRYLGKRPSCVNCLPLIVWSTSTTTAIAPSAMSDREIDQMTAALDDGAKGERSCAQFAANCDDHVAFGILDPLFASPAQNKNA